MTTIKKQEQKLRRHRRIRAKIFGTKERPRLAIFRSHQHIFAQLIDDQTGKTLASASDISLKSKNPKEVGKLIAREASKLKISKVVFDRAGYKYHGNVRALAEGAREGGLTF